MRAISERLVRVELGGEPRWGRLEGDEIALDGGRRLPEAEATYLAPVEPSKILAVHLSYRSRVEEYARADAGRALLLPQAALGAERAPRRRSGGRAEGGSSTTRASWRSWSGGG